MYSNLRKTDLLKKNKNYLNFFIFLFFISIQFYSQQQTYSFTNASATGSTGPTQLQINSAYAATNLSLVVSTSGVQSWTVPASGLYSIDITGASGGNSPTYIKYGGLGARMKGDFNLNAGNVVQILIGQRGQDGCGNGSGGGATYVVCNGTLLIAAGGGGGCTNQENGVNGTTLTAGTPDSQSVTAGGTNGGGGPTCLTGTHNGGGGGGYNLGNTGNGLTGSGGGGLSFLNGGIGGAAFFNTQAGPQGGFGGGGGGSYCTVGGGGGGGYSGGAGGQHLSNCVGNNLRTGGGGGGSYNVGINQLNAIGFQLGFGRAIIISLCNISLIPSSNPLCAGNSVTLTTNAASGILWNTGSTSNSIVVSPSVTTNYSVIGTSSANCVASSNVFITVQTPTSLNVTSTSNSVCLNATVALTASGANTYTWSGGILNGTSFTPSATTIYTLIATNACGTYSTTQTIIVSALPVIAISTSSAVCAGNVATLSAGGATTYTWMPGNIVGPNIIISPLATTIYTVTGTSGPCGGIANITVIAKPNPTVTTSASNSLICAGAQVTLTAFGASTYTWQSGPTVSSSLVVSPIAPTAYQVSGTNSLGCTSNSTQVVIVNPSPIINVIASETLICAGGSSTLTASGGSNYTWNFGPTTAAVVVSPTANTVYSVTSAGVGCNTTQTISVDVFTQTLTVSNSTAICMGSSITLNAFGGTTYLWSNGGTGSSIFVYPSVSTLYTVSAVTVINNMSCNSTGSVNLTINPNPTVTAVLTRSVICRGESTILKANGANTYVWNNTATTQSFVINPIINTNYTVTGTDANGCKGTGTVQIKVNTCTGISEINKEKGITIYPNPNNGEFTIESQLAIDLLIINELGQTVKNIQLSSANNLQLKVSDLANGIYFIVGKNKITNINQKIIVNK
jgi:hypothetical protein